MDKSCHLLSISILINTMVIAALPNYLMGLSMGANKIIYKSALLNNYSWCPMLIGHNVYKTITGDLKTGKGQFLYILSSEIGSLP